MKRRKWGCIQHKVGKSVGTIEKKNVDGILRGIGREEDQGKHGKGQ